MERRKITSITFGALLVLSAMFAPLGGNTSMVQNAEADEWAQTCKVGPVQVLAYSPFEICPDTETKKDQLKEADALETKVSLYSQLTTQKSNNNVLLTSLNNYLNDTRSIAIMEGKNAYIRALNNGTSESSARIAARGAIADYYSIKQKQLIASWNITAKVSNSSKYISENTSDISSDYVKLAGSTQTTDTHKPTLSWLNPQVHTETLVNGSQAPVLTISADGYDADNNAYSIPALHATPSTGSIEKQEYSTAQYSIRITGVIVQAPNDNYEKKRVVNFTNYANIWNEIQKQNSEVQNELDTFINATYDKYQEGEITNSELIDPYLGSREYAPENASGFQTWTLQALTSLGLNPPENLSNIGRMKIGYDGNEYTGILMSDGNPPNGFTIGNTYNANNLKGAQFIATADGNTQQLSGEFTLLSAETRGGKTYESGESIKYTNITYDTASTEEYQELSNQLTNLRMQINERQQELWSGGGGSVPSAPSWLTRNYFGFPLYAYVAAIVLMGYAGNALRGN